MGSGGVCTIPLSCDSLNFSAYALVSTPTLLLKICYILRSFTWELVYVSSDARQASEHGSIVSLCSVDHRGLLDASPLPSNKGGDITDTLADCWVHHLHNRQRFMYCWSGLVSSFVPPCRFTQDLVLFRGGAHNNNTNQDEGPLPPTTRPPDRHLQGLGIPPSPTIPLPPSTSPSASLDTPYR